MATIRFEEVSLKSRRKWLGSDGKWHQKTMKFWQTISPFNRNKETDLPKTREQIMEELIAERKAWEEIPIEQIARASR